MNSKQYFYSSIFSTPKPSLGVDDLIHINLYFVKLTHTWLDDEESSTLDSSDACFILFSDRENLYGENVITRKLSRQGIPREHQQVILDKLFPVVQAAVPEQLISVLIADITVRFEDHLLNSVETTMRRIPDFFDLVLPSLSESHTVNGDDFHQITITESSNVEEATRQSLETYREEFIPAARSAIRRLRKVRLGKLMKEGAIAETPSCSICEEDYFAEGGSGADQLITRLPCGHCFHADCIIQWLEISHICPLCRYAMPTLEEEGESNWKKSFDELIRRRLLRVVPRVRSWRRSLTHFAVWFFSAPTLLFAFFGI